MDLHNNFISTSKYTQKCSGRLLRRLLESLPPFPHLSNPSSSLYPHLSRRQTEKPIGPITPLYWLSFYLSSPSLCVGARQEMGCIYRKKYLKPGARGTSRHRLIKWYYSRANLICTAKNQYRKFETNIPTE